MSAREVSALSDFFKALGDPTRLKIISILAASGMLCVNGIAIRMKITQPAVSQHLKILKHAGILEADKEGVYVHYRIDRNAIEKMLDMIKKVCGNDTDACKCDECP
ncbi:MAG: helix-turn-helix transcriptional regulator [Spirochaetales bacterium]|nr:helix-turn-helix transcriptional regulator [Spirochaetales bacterium]